MAGQEFVPCLQVADHLRPMTPVVLLDTQGRVSGRGVILFPRVEAGDAQVCVQRDSERAARQWDVQWISLEFLAVNLIRLEALDALWLELGWLLWLDEADSEGPG